jgi:hypothetical protein
VSERPSTHVIASLHLDQWRQPAIEATAATLPGGERVFATIEVDTGSQAPERHSVKLVLIGPRQALLDLLGRLAGQVAAAKE